MKVEKAKRLAKIANLKNAHAAAVRQLALKNRGLHPDGRFDNAGRFYLDSKCACCSGIRAPSGAYPYSQMIHGRSAVHVANSFGVDVRDLRAIAKEIEHDSRLKNFELFFQDFGLALTWEAKAAIDNMLEITSKQKGASLDGTVAPALGQ